MTFALVNDTIEHLAPWMEFAANGYTEADAVAYLALCDEHWDSRRNFNYAIVAPDGRVVGSTGIMTERPEGGVEIGYWLHRDYTGQGIATKASRAQIEAAWLMGATHVIIVHDSNNHRSGAVPARLGFTEVERRVGVEPPTAVKTGTKVVWRLDRK
ncbi:RimJ/RimL family protein N-acetyltransferase [Allocatelliglobosispora scoriae]|uniref:RimJ/RimL family protein N-acetyltransferase n=1 Tax=Allocatelliglobosispora scoriae TaxID=643052 RepID=A0A841BJQ3_9ACTN|nr:GNAT family N-acetyltransferase [Allocatelliglobosispora scoriae]MBB5867050.1 RimJ/RimL family protein N-acetyltransferase [Allocatelliglobosispora scoriae]